MKNFRFISAWIFIFSVAAAIFMFSSQPAEKSSDVSSAVSEKLFKGKIEEKYSEDINSRLHRLRDILSLYSTCCVLRALRQSVQLSVK